MLRLSYVAVAAAFALSLQAAVPSEEVVSAWFKMNALLVTMKVPGVAETLNYNFEVTANSDLRVNIVSKEATGNLMLISGVLVARDLPVKPGYEIDALDAPVLTMQLVNKLLAAAAGVAPNLFRGHRKVDFTEATVPIHIATPSAEGQYPAPWSLMGSLDGAPGLVTFRLKHSFKDANGNSYAVEYAGRWEQRSVSPTIPDSASLTGWKVFGLGPRKEVGAGGTTLDYGATQSATVYPNVGALRAAIRKRQKSSGPN